MNPEYNIDMMKEWAANVIHSEATPQEVRDAVVNSIREQINYHLDCVERASELLSLLNHHDKKNEKSTNSQNFTSSKVKEAATDKDWEDFWKGNTPDELFEAKMQKEGYEYTPPTSHNRVTHLPTRY